MPTVCNIETQFLSKFKERLHDMYKQEWWAQVCETSDHRLYKQIKVSFKYENYLNVCLKSFRICLSRIRLSSHLFGVERGRWGAKKLPYEGRTCRMCGEIEDEFHCLIQCPMYANARRGCLPDSLKGRNVSMYNFVQFFLF